LAGLVDRIRFAFAAREAGDTVPVVTATAEEADNIRYIFALAEEDARPRSLIALLGDPQANVGEVLESVAAACRNNGEFPVAVMSELRPGLIAAVTVPVEFMPARRYLPVTAAEYERHLRRRWSLMMAKWEFAKHIEMGVAFEDFLTEQLDSAAVPAAGLTPEPAEREADRSS
jgi:hypothetical protein